MVFEMLMEMYFNLNGDVYVLFTTDLPRKVNLPHTLRNVPISHNIRFFFFPPLALIFKQAGETGCDQSTVCIPVRCSSR